MIYHVQTNYWTLQGLGLHNIVGTGTVKYIVISAQGKKGKYVYS